VVRRGDPAEASSRVAPEQKDIIDIISNLNTLRVGVHIKLAAKGGCFCSCFHVSGYLFC